MAGIRGRHPKFLEALLADARTTAAYRGERSEFRSQIDAVLQSIRLMVVTDAFLSQACYRLKARLQTLGVPVVPRVLHRLAMALAQVSIGDPVVIAPGLYLVHGQVVIDGFTEIGAGTVISPFVTIGLQPGRFEGPVIGSRVQIGTGAKILGRIHIGNRARIGANAVVLSDVPANATATGVPARVHSGTEGD
jgi:serine O-acetyltransferase